MAARHVVVVGASAGGIEALQQMVAGFPPDLAASVLVVLHMGPGSGGALPRILDRAGPLPALAATEGEPLEESRIYVCVADHHLLVSDGEIRLRRGPRENGHRPAVDPLFRSAAVYYGPAALGVVLSGSLSDGTAGLSVLRRQGGRAVVQDPAEAIYDGMPASAIEHVGADHVVKAAEIGPLVGRLVLGMPPTVRPPVPELLAKEVALMESEPGVEWEETGRPSPWPCPDCNGVLWEIHDDTVLRFRCRVGHAWAAADLLSVQGSAIETALWTALRALEDRVTLMHTLADRARRTGRTIGARRFEDDVAEYERSVEVLRELLTGRKTGDTGREQ